MLDVTIQSLGGVAVLRCAGRIMGGRESEILRVAVVSQSNARTVVLDLSEVETLDGRGIGILISLQGWAHANGKKLRLTNPRANLCLSCCDSRTWIQCLKSSRQRTLH